MLGATLLAALVLLAPAPDARDLASAYARAVRTLNQKHLEQPGDTTESDLAARFPKDAVRALDRLLDLPDDADGLTDALLLVGEGALDLCRMEDFERARARLGVVAPERVDAALGTALVREHFLLRGIGGLDTAYLARFADALDGILDAYDEVFGFEEWSKVPGKRLRVRVHLEERITRPPHFAPQFRFHSEIDFPVIDPERFASPTPQGQFLFYGLCHELGHVVAMWGDRRNEEDRHQWAHYTGVAIVEHLAARSPAPEWLQPLRDVRWRSLTKARETVAGTEPSMGTSEGVLATLLALHDLVGPRAIGAAINRLDHADERLRVNGVRYYTFAELRAALLAGEKDPARRKRVAALLPGD